MKKIHIKKPDIKGAFHKLKNLKTEDVKAAADVICGDVTEEGIYYYCIEHGLI